MMKALSIRQPWASRILRGEKRIEVRTWTTRHRGPLLICASLRPESHCPETDDLPTGVALCVVELLDVRPMTRHDEAAAGIRAFAGAYAWVLGQVTPIDPFAVSGRLGLFDVDAGIMLRRFCRQEPLF